MDKLEKIDLAREILGTVESIMDLLAEELINIIDACEMIAKLKKRYTREEAYDE